MKKAQKTDNFLKAIRKYAEKQRQTMKDEVEQLRDEKLRQAESKGKADSEKYISDMLEAKKNEETSKLAKLMQDGQRQLFIERSEMTDSIFAKAEKKLIAYTESDEYTEKLIQSAKAVAKLLGSEGCVLYVKAEDMDKADRITSLFNGKTEVEADKSIKIGGIKGYCPAMGIVADETLDSKLSQQKEWFVENSGLSVL